jgi:LPS export ABC transporter permease LptG
MGAESRSTCHAVTTAVGDPTRWAHPPRRARRDGHHGIALPPANACASRGALRSDGGARPIAICPARAAAAISDRLASPSAPRAARAQRWSVGHRVTSSTVVDQAQTRRRTSATGSRAMAHSVNAIAIAFFCYFLVFVSLTGMARLKQLPSVLWIPNAIFLVAGVVMLARMERPGDSDFFSDLRARIAMFFESVKARFASAEQTRFSGWRLPLVPQIVDTYILSKFLFYLALILTSFVSLILIFNFFELIPDMLRNNVPLRTMFEYLFFLTPKLIYLMVPVSVLVAVLATFGVMTKQNEITAFKACGVSLYRLAVPVLLLSTLLSGGLFAFDYYYVPAANRRQDHLRDVIKGRATQTYLRPDRTWKMGSNSNRIFYYRFFDVTGEVSTMNEVSVFELDQRPYRLARQIYAKRARWNPSRKTWVFEEGWTCTYRGAFCDSHTVFEAATFREITEKPDYFFKEDMKDTQMNVNQLDRYIQYLTSSGFEGTVKLQVRLYSKFSIPFFALIMAMIAIPFGFLVGNRGAMTWIGVSIGIGIMYMAIGPLFQKVGDAGLLVPAVAAWAPDALFGIAGLYLLLRMRS